MAITSEYIKSTLPFPLHTKLACDLFKHDLAMPTGFNDSTFFFICLNQTYKFLDLLAYPFFAPTMRKDLSKTCIALDVCALLKLFFMLLLFLL